MPHISDHTDHHGNWKGGEKASFVGKGENVTRPITGVQSAQHYYGGA